MFRRFPEQCWMSLGIHGTFVGQMIGCQHDDFTLVTHYLDYTISNKAPGATSLASLGNTLKRQHSSPLPVDRLYLSQTCLDVCFGEDRPV